MAAYHKVPRGYLGVSVPDLEAVVADWRRAPVAERVAVARALWTSDVHEARIAAAKLLTQARIREDETLVWAELRRWVPAFDGWAVADHACKAIERRLVALPERLDEVEGWTGNDSLWVRRAALVATLPWSKLTHPSGAEIAARERILWVGGGLCSGSRMVHPEGGRLVAAKPWRTRRGARAAVPGRAGKGTEGFRAARGRAADAPIGSARRVRPDGPDAGCRRRPTVLCGGPGRSCRLRRHRRSGAARWQVCRGSRGGCRRAARSRAR